MSRFNTPKAQSNRRRQLERMGVDEDKILDILDYEFGLEMGNYPNMPLPGKSYEDGGVIDDPLKGLSNADKRRILKIGNEGVQNLVGNDFKAYNVLIDNQRKGIRNFATFREGGSIGSTSRSARSIRGTGAAVRGTRFKGVF